VPGFAGRQIGGWYGKGPRIPSLVLLQMRNEFLCYTNIVKHQPNIGGKFQA
jgi:hypothetical protein